MKISSLRTLLLCSIALIPLEIGAQTALPQGPAPIDLGLIPVGEERVVQLIGRLDLATATQQQVMAASRSVRFQIAENSGFCLALEAPGAATTFFVIGREGPGAPILFDVNTGLIGISSAQGRRTLARSTSPLAQTTILLEGVVGQSSSAPGDTLNVVIRAYLDSTPVPAIEMLCGPTLR